jgi:hypothetical protein
VKLPLVCVNKIALVCDKVDIFGPAEITNKDDVVVYASVCTGFDCAMMTVCQGEGARASGVVSWGVGRRRSLAVMQVGHEGRELRATRLVGRESWSKDNCRIRLKLGCPGWRCWSGISAVVSSP